MSPVCLILIVLCVYFIPNNHNCVSCISVELISSDYHSDSQKQKSRLLQSGNSAILWRISLIYQVPFYFLSSTRSFILNQVLIISHWKYLGIDFMAVASYERHEVINQRQINCLFKSRPFVGNRSVIFPTQRAANAESVSRLWCDIGVGKSPQIDMSCN